MLQALTDAGVVDAGYRESNILRGAYAALARGESPAADGVPSMSEVAAVPATTQIGIREVESIEFRYCTELIVTGSDIPLDALRDKLAALGDSLLVVGDREAAKVHVHTNHPPGLGE